MNALLLLINPLQQQQQQQRKLHTHEPGVRRCLSVLCNFCNAVAYTNGPMHSKPMKDALLWHAVREPVAVIAPRVEICDIAQEGMFHLTKPRESQQPTRSEPPARIMLKANLNIENSGESDDGGDANGETAAQLLVEP